MAQTSDWSKVEALTRGTKIRVSARGARSICLVETVDSNSLECTEVRAILFFPIRTRQQFRRADVRTVKLSRQGVSTLAGTAIGLGAGAGIGAGIDASAKSNEDGNLATILLGLFGALIGSAVGEHTDFLAGPVIYQAP